MSTYLGNQLLSGVATDTISNAHTLLDFKWTDHILNEMSWLRADTFSWHNGLLYKAAYNHLVEDVNGKSADNSDTIGSYTIWYVLADDGHKIVGPDQEVTANNIYNESGVSWYYILDKTNQRFKLPRENPSREELLQVVRAKGNGMTLGLTNGDNNYAVFSNGYTGYTSGYGASVGSNSRTGSISSDKAQGITTDSTKSGIISDMKDSTSVYKGKKYLYFYVGEYSQSQAEQVATLDVEMFNNKVDTNMLNLTDTGKNIANWSNNVTNCITEIPQDIKLELNNGTLTLKAGSKVYVPNDVGVFTEVITTQDISRSAFGTDTGDNRYIFPVYSNGAITGLSWGSLTSVSSGTTPPTSGVFYNTSTNYINLYSSGSVTDQRGFPIGMITLSSGAPTSIDQVFNGFGFIGSTIFALPGVKGLIPNGRNTDGTLKNTEFTTTTVLTFTNSTGSATYRDAVIQMDSGFPRLSRNIVAYDEVQNYNHDTTLSGAVIPMIAIAGMQLNNGVISSFDLKTSFHALDYNDKRTIVGWGMPNYNTGVNITSLIPTSGSYRFSEKCFVFVRCTKEANSSSTATLSINGVSYDICWTSANNQWREQNNFLLPLDVNDTLSHSTVGTWTFTKFSMKGV